MLETLERSRVELESILLKIIENFELNSIYIIEVALCIREESD